MQKWFQILMIFATVFGFSQNSDSLKIENKRFDFSYQKLYVPAALMITGVAVNGSGPNSIKNQIKDYRNEHMPNFRTHVDDYLQFAPFAAVYGFEFLGMKPRTDWQNRTAILVKGQMINLGLVYILKKTAKQTRPDGTQLSFPSGHTADAFAGATMLSIEYGENYKWVPYAAYGVASSVGILRMANNRHYISDVLFGAGLGILSTKVAYWTHQYKWNQNKTDHDPFSGVIYNK